MGQNIQKMIKRRPNEGGTGMRLRQHQVFCLVESQMVIFNFGKAGTEHVAIATSNGYHPVYFVGCNIPAKFQ